MTRIDPISMLVNADMNNADMFYRGMRKYFLYFEDKGKENIYRKIIEELFPEKKDYVYVDTTCTGKSDLIKKYFDSTEKYVNTSNERYIFVLDKDFDDKRIFRTCKNLLKKTFIEIKNHENFLILNKYSIENYFLEKKEIVAKGSFVAFGSGEEFIIENFDKIKNLLIEASKIMYIPNIIDLENKSNIPRIIDYSTINLKNDEIIKIEKEYEKNFNERKEKKMIFQEKTCSGDFDYHTVKKIILNLFDNTRDIIGKELMITIIKIFKVHRIILRECDKNIFFRALLSEAFHHKEEVLKELKRELSIIFDK